MIIALTIIWLHVQNILLHSVYVFVLIKILAKYFICTSQTILCTAAIYTFCTMDPSVAFVTAVRTNPSHMITLFV